MTSRLNSPGIYITEKNTQPSSVVQIETAVPVFIGYTETAGVNGSFVNVPRRINRFAEYVEYFGSGFKSKFTIQRAEKAKVDPGSEPVIIGNEKYIISYAPGQTALMFNSIRLFYANGGGPCYILSVGTYRGKSELEIKESDYHDVFAILENEFEPSLIVIPDITSIGEDAYALYRKALEHAGKTQNRFAIFDLVPHGSERSTTEVVSAFRQEIRGDFLRYGAAYYPWLHTRIVQADEVDLENFAKPSQFADLLPEEAAKNVVKAFLNGTDCATCHAKLVATSTAYVTILEAIIKTLNHLPPSAAMAGIYTLTDSTKGVWKSPANIGLSAVLRPATMITNEEQTALNIDPIGGKSINAIRAFPGHGNLVWGGRTLDGNSLDWRYINVRRTLIMIEQSLKFAVRAYGFEPNDSSTWLTVKAMLDSFLHNLWTQGALAGSVPEEAFDVQVGLGTTMSAEDILAGRMIISVRLAVTRPAEFIVITIQQQMVG